MTTKYQSTLLNDSPFSVVLLLMSIFSLTVQHTFYQSPQAVKCKKNIYTNLYIQFISENIVIIKIYRFQNATQFIIENIYN